MVVNLNDLYDLIDASTFSAGAILVKNRIRIFKWNVYSRQQFPLEILFVVLQWFNLIAENIFSWTFAVEIGYYA
ncbi:MAG: hypothetical protein OXC66_08285, partial [Roseovarius sp.]|nr:hypothetical protein [Roseovarius sp.]